MTFSPKSIHTKQCRKFKPVREDSARQSICRCHDSRSNCALRFAKCDFFTSVRHYDDNFVRKWEIYGD